MLMVELFRIQRTDPDIETKPEPVYYSRLAGHFSCLKDVAKPANTEAMLTVRKTDLS